MARTVITQDGDMVDLIAWRAYGKTTGPTEAILEANRWLADYPATLPAGLTIILPDLAEPAAVRQVNIWD
ncbi:MAG: tail protein X [Rhodobiaceae bacterium]|nr:tail protein X [Rhodobiaceae bacterium]